jgi:CRISPR-associated protein Cas2
MPVNRPTMYVISYDIADPSRLARVHRRLRNEGLPLQYSVFHVCLPERTLRELLSELSGLIEPREDDIRVYPLPDSVECRFLGQQMFPEDVMLIRAGRDLLGTAKNNKSKRRGYR